MGGLIDYEKLKGRPTTKFCCGSYWVGYYGETITATLFLVGKNEIYQYQAETF